MITKSIIALTAAIFIILVAIAYLVIIAIVSSGPSNPMDSGFCTTPIFPMISVSTTTPLIAMFILIIAITVVVWFLFSGDDDEINESWVRWSGEYEETA